MNRSRSLPALCAAALLAGLPQSSSAGGSGESAVLIVDPTDAESLYVANTYAAARGIPATNLLFMDPAAPDYPTFVNDNQAGFLGTLEGRGLGHVDFVVVMPTDAFYVSAPGLVADSCSPVNRFSIAAPFALSFNADKILAGTGVGIPNRYFANDDSAVAFDSSVAWFGGQPSNSSSAERYFIGAMLGYTGLRGNTLDELLDMIETSVAADGTQPTSTYFFCETNDILRSGPRHGYYPAVSAAINALGGMAEHLLADLPVGRHDCQGIMTGLANPNVVGGDFTILPGAFCDHLTSYAGAFDVGSQTKMSRWIEKGASATSGAVEEPCNYPGKFPHARLHLYAFQGLSLGEAWFRSMRYYVFQNLLYGDPLTRPYAHIPSVDVPDAPSGPVGGVVSVTPVGATTMPGADVEDIDLFVDGRLVRTGVIGQSLPIDTTALDDGWHELRVVAYDDSTIRSAGSWIGALVVDNAGATATIGAPATSGNLTDRFDFTVEAPGSAVAELRLLGAGRVLGTVSTSPGVISVFGQNLGAGPVRVQAEAVLSGGGRVRSAPLELSIDYSSGAVAGIAPQAFRYTKRVRDDVATLVELPSAFDDDLASASFSIIHPPSQGSLAPGGSGPYRIFRPNAGASGPDSLVFQVTTPSGVSGQAIVQLEFTSGFDCLTPTSYCQTAPNSVGGGALIYSTGSPSVVANDLVLEVTGATPSQFGIFYYGSTQIQIPFGDGFRCVGAGSTGTFRLPIITTDAFGDASFPLDVNDPPAAAGPGAVVAGADWNFQFWYRDPAGPGGSGFNFSDGLAVGFCP